MGDNIILVGFMGTGKSAIGRRLAYALNWPFYDADLEMEKTIGMSLTTLCRKYGKVRFHSEEKLILHKLLQKEKSVIATGGTLIIDDDWLKLMHQSGIIVCLTARTDIIQERVLRRNNRPFLRKHCIRDDIAALSKEREAIQYHADLVIDTSDATLDEVLCKILIYCEREFHGIL